MSGWIGVDLDGTLAHYDGWRGDDHIGAPVPAMVDRVKTWLNEGHEVRIFTARVAHPLGIGSEGVPTPMTRAETVKLIQAWSLQHVGAVLPVTNMKDYGMIQLWDDRAVTVVTNTGLPCCGTEQNAARCDLLDAQARDLIRRLRQALQDAYASRRASCLASNAECERGDPDTWDPDCQKLKAALGLKVPEELS